MNLFFIGGNFSGISISTSFCLISLLSTDFSSSSSSIKINVVETGLHLIIGSDFSGKGGLISA